MTRHRHGRQPNSRLSARSASHARGNRQPARFSQKRSEQYADDAPRHDPLGGLPKGLSVHWNEKQIQICDARLWPQTRLMRPMIGQLVRLPTHTEVLSWRMNSDRLAYRPPAAATTPDALVAVAATIHRLFRYLEAENHYLDIRLPKAADVRRNILEIKVQPRIARKPVALQLKQLERAARTGDPLAWEVAWRGTTMPALRVLDLAREEAMADKRHPLKLQVDCWCEGQILSSMIPTAEYVAKLLPIAQRIAAELRNPGRQAEDATVKSLCAVFRTLTGCDAEVRRGGHSDEGQKRWQRARGSAVLFILWLMFCFRSLLVESGAYGTWRRSVRGREVDRTKAADRKNTGIVGTT